MKQKKAPAQTGTDLHAVVYARARPAVKRQYDRVLGGLYECLDDGRISDLQIRVWPKSISLTHDGIPRIASEVERTKKRAERRFAPTSARNEGYTLQYNGRKGPRSAVAVSLYRTPGGGGMSNTSTNTPRPAVGDEECSLLRLSGRNGGTVTP